MIQSPKFALVTGRASGSPSVKLGAINTSLLRGDEGVPSSSVGRLGSVLQGEELVRTLSGPLYPKLSTSFEGTRLTQLVLLVTV